MERGGKGKGRVGREVVRWPGCGSERSRVLTFLPLGLEAPEGSRAAAHFPVPTRYVCKELSPVGGPPQEEGEFTMQYLGSIKNRL